MTMADSTLDNKRVLDVGSGPRPLAYSMDGIQLYVIEPLGYRFLIEAEKRLKANDGAYLEIQKAVKVYSSLHPEKSPVPTIMQHIYDAGLRFDRGNCLSAPAYPALAFNSCWFILSKNKDYTSTP